jgi:hypothetical protein
MDDAELSARSGASPGTGSAAGSATGSATPSEAELSRMAREAVRQPADPRLDRQLARMGLADAPATGLDGTARAEAERERTDRLERRVRRLEIATVLLIVAVVVLAAALVARTTT